MALVVGLGTTATSAPLVGLGTASRALGLGTTPLVKLPRYPGVRYPSIERVAITLGTLKINVGGGQMKPFKVVAVYDQRVVLEMPNHKGGARYLSLSYEQIEYPLYSIACRAIVADDALRLFPRRNQAAQRDEYVEEHWRDIYPSVMNTAALGTLRQDRYRHLT